MIVVDASAMIALLRKEPGFDLVAREAVGGVMSALNLAETYSRLFDLTQIAPIEWERAIEPLSLSVIPFDEAAAVAAAKLRPATKRLGLSLGDRACLALAIERKLPVLTGDRVWATLDLGVEVRLIR